VVPNAPAGTSPAAVAVLRDGEDTTPAAVQGSVLRYARGKSPTRRLRNKKPTICGGVRLTLPQMLLLYKVLMMEGFPRPDILRVMGRRSQPGTDAKLLTPRERAIRFANRFWRSVAVGSENECWPFVGAIAKRGYGRFASWPAHRLAFRLTHGAVTDGLVVMHSCDNPPCCNPAHLSEGTITENNLDCQIKGRLGRKTSPRRRRREHPLREVGP